MIFNRTRISPRDKVITTTPGQLGAGETETEADEPPHHLPTTRIIPTTPPTSTLLFESSRLLAIVPAVFGTLSNIFHILYPPPHPTPHPIDYAVSALWALLTGYQCLALTSGLLTRWRLYYPPLPTLIRLLALQAICWPATHITLTLCNAAVRPTACWALVGTTTCLSRAVQIWVTSNLWWERDTPPPSLSSTTLPSPADPDSSSSPESPKPKPKSKPKRTTTVPSGYWKRWRGGKWGGRRWDWAEVGVQCVLPAAVVYFVMAWAEVVRREIVGC